MVPLLDGPGRGLDCGFSHAAQWFSGVSLILVVLSCMIERQESEISRPTKRQPECATLSIGLLDTQEISAILGKN